MPQRAVDKFVDLRSGVHTIPMIGVGRFPMLEVPEQFAAALETAHSNEALAQPRDIPPTAIVNRKPLTKEQLRCATECSRSANLFGSSRQSSAFWRSCWRRH